MLHGFLYHTTRQGSEVVTVQSRSSEPCRMEEGNGKQRERVMEPGMRSACEYAA